MTVMQKQIANPTYDVVFKYLMEDNDIAKLMVSSIIGEDVVSLEPRPHEYTVDDVKAGKDTLTVYRLDFSAKIRTSDGYRLVLIEMQKATIVNDIMRFRGYLVRQFANINNVVTDEDGTIRPLQIYAIYFLGKDLEICDTPVLRIFPTVIDVATGDVIVAKNKFIEAMNHKCWVIQISCLKQRRRTELELLLSVFDQSNITSDIHILNVREEDFPQKFRSVIRRLKIAASSKEIKKDMENEDSYLLHLKDIERSAAYKTEAKVRKEMEGIIAQKDHALEQERKRVADLQAQVDELKKLIKPEE
jgi:hypothetical protein